MTEIHGFSKETLYKLFITLYPYNYKMIYLSLIPAIPLRLKYPKEA